jgi:uncharacterized protein (TIGR02145 family)
MKIIIGLIVLIIMATSSFAGGCADVNNSGNLNLLDVAYIINHLYRGGPEFNCGASSTGICGDVNGTGTINLLDVAYLINFLYRGGPAPKCGEVTDIDGNLYQIVTIGTQVWMAENLKVTHYSNGDDIPNVTDGITWIGLTTGAYCEYDNDINNVATYGRLYNWYAIADSRNIAPMGWHIPSDAEWKQLEMYLGMSQAQADTTGWRGTTEGGKIKEIGTTHWFSPNAGATNESGFSGLPGGYSLDDGTYWAIGWSAYFWLSTGYGSNTAWYRYLHNDRSVVYRSDRGKRCGFSVRCVRD